MVWNIQYIKQVPHKQLIEYICTRSINSKNYLPQNTIHSLTSQSEETIKSQNELRTTLFNIGAHIDPFLLDLSPSKHIDASLELRK